MPDEYPTSYARHVGLRLRRIRKQHGLSLQAVEAATEQRYKASVLGAYERGERVISVPRLQGLAEFYRVPTSQLLPRPNAPEQDTAAETSGPRRGDDKVTLDLTRLSQAPAPERELIGRFVRMIQVRRQDFNGQVLTVRNDDLLAMAALIDTEPELVRHRLDKLGLRF